jgi:hypothetical protein
MVNFDLAPPGEHHQTRRTLWTVNGSNRTVPCIIGIRREEHVDRRGRCLDGFYEILGTHPRSILDLLLSALHATWVLVDELSLGRGGETTNHALSISNKVSEDMRPSPSRQQGRLPELLVGDVANRREKARVRLSTVGDVWPNRRLHGATLVRKLPDTDLAGVTIGDLIAHPVVFF